MTKLTPGQVRELRRQHAYATRTGRMTKTTATKTIRTKEGWLTWIKKFRMFGTKKPKFNAIPANLRPWIPHRRHILGHASIPELTQYAEELRTVCTKAQWKQLKSYFWRLK